MVLLSQNERLFILHGVESNIRTDGREQLQYRPIDLETGLIPSSMGSARVVIGSTDLIVSVNANTFTPSIQRPNEGKLEFFIHFSGVASPEYEGRKGEQKSDQMTTIFNKLYSGVRLDFLCIEPRVKSWKLNVDVSVLSLEGNLYDAVSFGVKAALATTNIPVIKVTSEDKGEKEYKISDDPSDTWIPDVSNIPCFVTILKVGDVFLIDATNNEEQCSTFNCVVGVTECGSVVSTLKIGPGSLQPTTFINAIKQAVDVGSLINSELKNILDKERSIKRREIVGLLT